MRLAYLTGRYPEISHTFILGEVRALRDLGAEIETFSIWRTDESQLLSPADREEHGRTYALLPLRPLDAMRALLAGLRGSPVAMGSTLVRAVKLGRPGLRGRLLAASWFLEALILWDQMRRRDLRHVHVHINGTAPFVALLATGLGNATEPGGHWTWSLTVHGPSEFY